MLDGRAPRVGQRGCGEPSRSSTECKNGMCNLAYPWFIEVDSAHLALADLRRRRKLFQGLVGDKTLVDARQGIHESLQDAFQKRDDLRKLDQRSAAIQCFGIVGNGLDAKYRLWYKSSGSTCRSAA